jgi:hypothetical protein
MSPDSTPGIGAVAARGVDETLELIESSIEGLTPEEATRRLGVFGPNAVRSHRVRPLVILGHQFANPIGSPASGFVANESHHTITGGDGQLFAWGHAAASAQRGHRPFMVRCHRAPWQRTGAALLVQSSALSRGTSMPPATVSELA